jgi:hypothetical protein
MKSSRKPACPTCGLPLAVVKTWRLGAQTRRLRRCAHGHVVQTVEAPCPPITPRLLDRLLRSVED